MKIPGYRDITLDDAPDAPEWFESIPQALNTSLSSITLACQGNLTFGDNVMSEDFETTLTHGVELIIQLRSLKSRPNFVLAGYNPIGVTGCSITKILTNTQIGVTVYFNGAPTTPQTLTLRFFP